MPRMLADVSPRAKTLRLQEVWAGPLFLGHSLGSAAQCCKAAKLYHGAKDVKTVKIWEVDRQTRRPV